MQISGEEKINFTLALIALFGGGVAMTFQETAPVGCVLMAIAVIGLITLAFHHRFPRKEKAKISLRVGENHLLEKKKSHIWGHKKTFSVGVENEEKDKSLRNGTLQILSIFPYVGSNGPWILKRDVSVDPGGCEFIPLLEYSESGESSVSASTFATVLTEGQHRPLLGTERKKYEMALNLTAENRSSTKLRCEIWFEGGAIHIKESSKPE